MQTDSHVHRHMHACAAISGPCGGHSHWPAVHVRRLTQTGGVGAQIGQIYGTKIGSLPPGARSYYDTLGDSVVWSVRYGFGMLTYVGNNMQQAFEMGPWHKVLRASVAI
eukprot:3893907-Rhodomonas_salina.1